MQRMSSDTNHLNEGLLDRPPVLQLVDGTGEAAYP